MPVHDTGLVLFNLQQANKPLPSLASAGVRIGESLKVGIEAGLGILRQDVVLDPSVEQLARPSIDIGRFVVAGLFNTLNQPHEVVRTRRKVLLAKIVGNLVVGLRDEVGRVAGLGGVAVGLERVDLGHEVPG